MTKRMTVTAFLTVVISVMAVAVVTVLFLNAWDSFVRLRTAQQLTSVAEASAWSFKVMHKLRTARAITSRNLEGSTPVEPALRSYLSKVRTGQREAVASLLATLPSVQFSGSDNPIEALRAQTIAFDTLDESSFEAVAKPQSERQDGLAKAYATASSALLVRLENLSGDLAGLASHKDPVVDQLFALKQLAWLLRNSAGDTTVLVSRSIEGSPPTAQEQQRYERLLGSMEMAWSSIESLVSKTQLSADVVTAIDAAKGGNFDPDYMALRNRLFEAPSKGQKPEMSVSQWVSYGVDRLTTAVTLAERALDAAQQHAVDQKASALYNLLGQSFLLACALLLAVGSMLGVRRLVIVPLRGIRYAMIELADGNLSVETPSSERQDEIGALAHALSAFKANALEKARIEEEQRQQASRAVERQQVVERYIADFEEQMSRALASLTTASDQMRETSSSMSSVSVQTSSQVKSAEKASDEASLNVQSVASASEQLTATIADIGRQAVQAADIAARAVEQATTTDRTVQGLAESASRIGEVVELINGIANQTNLLALNATIEAARAGESGKGFAVVASEVKTLATQTAKATGEIAGQISAVQKAAGEAVEAIKTIGRTIGEVSEVASTIAAAVEEQGAATREISANTQLAAEGTRSLSQGITGVTAGAEATGAAAQAVMTAVQVLDCETKELRSQINTFLGHIRAA